MGAQWAALRTPGARPPAASDPAHNSTARPDHRRHARHPAGLTTAVTSTWGITNHIFFLYSELNIFRHPTSNALRIDDGFSDASHSMARACSRICELPQFASAQCAVSVLMI